MTKKVKAEITKIAWKDQPATGRQVAYVQGLLIKAGTGNVKRMLVFAIMRYQSRRR